MNSLKCSECGCMTDCVHRSTPKGTVPAKWICDDCYKKHPELPPVDAELQKMLDVFR